MNVNYCIFVLILCPVIVVIKSTSMLIDKTCAEHLLCFGPDHAWPETQIQMYLAQYTDADNLQI